MKISTSIKTLALAAGMLFAFGQNSEAKLQKPSGGSSSSNLVISKVFYSGSTRLNGATPKNYMLVQFVELYNNSSDTLDISGLYVAFPNSDGAAAAWTAADMATEHKDSIVVKQIFQIPTDKTYSLNPGSSIVIANSAIDHSQIAEGNIDLSGADFEVKSTNNAYKDYHNDNVPAMTLISTFGTTDFINLLNPGPSAVILLAADTKIDQCPQTYGKGKTSGSLYTIVPGFKTIDAVDIVKQKSPAATDKRIPDNYDAGFTCTESDGTFSGQLVYRKTAFITRDGRTVLWDTNNSSNDFASANAADMPIRTYSREIVGLTDSTIVIPESGYLAFKATKPFCGPRGMILCHVSASNNASTTDLKYNEFNADSLLYIKGDWIAIAKPGTYTLKLSDSQGVMKTRSSSQAWSDEDSKTLTGSQATRRIYKFSNEAGKVGFKRVPATADGKYNVADFTDGNRLYLTLTDQIGNRIFAANGVDSWDNLEFIPWHGSTPDDAAAGIRQTITATTNANAPVYNLSGQRVRVAGKGIYIQNGKKFVVK